MVGEMVSVSQLSASELCEFVIVPGAEVASHLAKWRVFDNEVNDIAVHNTLRKYGTEMVTVFDRSSRRKRVK